MMSDTTYELKLVELVGMAGVPAEAHLNEYAALGYRLVSYDHAKRVAVFERPLRTDQHE
jgi:hypothetical protein